MAEVTGPISSLPGTKHPVPKGTMCDNHPNRPATHRVQGETDSFGSELHDECDECHAAVLAEPPPTGNCDWCKAPDQELVHMRDFEEGLAGPVYMVCKPCRKNYNDRINEEMEEDYDD